MKNFLSQTRSLLETREQRYVRYFRHAVKLWMQEAVPLDADEVEIRRDMSLQSRKLDFTGAYRKLSIEADADDWLQTEKEEFERTESDSTTPQGDKKTKGS